VRQGPALRPAEIGIDTIMAPRMPKIQLRIFLKLLCFTLASGSTGVCHAHAKLCSPTDAEAAETAVDQLDSWTEVQLAVKKYSHCDDGSIAEGNFEAVSRLLVDHWATLPLLTELVKRDPALQRFVLRHIDATLDTGDLGKIAAYASTRCPKGSAHRCGQLAKAATGASR
jgi:hypothetical protein